MSLGRYVNFVVELYIICELLLMLKLKIIYLNEVSHTDTQYSLLMCYSQTTCVYRNATLLILNLVP